jgi:glycosyltransferase involved in cell wall biosynthesis
MDFSIIIPTYNRPDQLNSCLDALSQIEYAADRHEIIVVDDGGDADLKSVVERSAVYPRLRLVHQRNRGPGAARNLGASTARGRWLAFTDDDCRPSPSWLSDLEAALADDHNLLVGGTTVNALKDNVYSEASHLIMDAAYSFFNGDRLRARFLASSNMGAWRETFRNAGGFDESFRPASEDREFCDRWRWSGRSITWIDGAVVAHYHALTLEGFLRQHFDYGRGAYLFHRRRNLRGSGKIQNDLSFYSRTRDLLTRPALAGSRPLTTLSLLALWQVANTAGFFAELSRSALHGDGQDGLGAAAGRTD